MFLGAKIFDLKEAVELRRPLGETSNILERRLDHRRVIATSQ